MKFQQATISIATFLIFVLFINQSQQEICTSAGQQKISLSGIEYTIFCEAGPLNQLWAVIIHRQGGTVNFNQPFTTCALLGMGSFTTEFFISLNIMHQLTSAFTTELYIKMADGADQRWAFYSSFSVGDLASKYKLSVGGYKGNAGNDLSYQNNMKWSTSDQDNDNKGSGSCAADFNGPNWHNSCYDAFPLNSMSSTLWYSFQGTSGSIDYMKWMIRQKKCSNCQICPITGGYMDCIPCGAEGAKRVPGLPAGTCISDCSTLGENYYAKNAICSQCHISCKTCQDSQDYNCTQCADGLKQDRSSPLKDPKKCVAACPPGTSDFGDFCQPCYKGCNQCIDINDYNCVECAEGFKQDRTAQIQNPKRCVQTCPSGTFQQGNFCEKCDQSCKECTDRYDNNCTECPDGSLQDTTYLMKSPKKCVKTCPTGSNLRYDGVCINCSIEKRQYFDTVSQTCEYCNIGMILKGDSCSAKKVKIKNIEFKPQNLSLVFQFNYQINKKNLTLEDFVLKCDKVKDSQDYLIFDNLQKNVTNILKLQVKQNFPQDISNCKIALATTHLATVDQAFSISPNQFFQQNFTIKHSRNNWSWIDLLPFAHSVLGLVITIGFAVSNLFLDVPIEPYWNLILTYQLIALSPMMRINFPTLLDKIVAVLKFMIGQIGYLRKVYQLSIGRLFSFDEEKSLFPCFRSNFLLENSPIFVTLLMLSFLIFGIILIVLRLVHKKRKHIQSKCYRFTLVFRFNCQKFVLRALILTFLPLLTASCINLYSMSFNSISNIVSSILSIILIIILIAFPFGLIDIFAQSIRRKRRKDFRDKYSSIYHLFRYRSGFWQSIYYPLILLQRIIYIFVAMFLSFKSQNASAIVMIIVAFFILLYLQLVRPFRHDFNNYLAAVSQLFLTLFYAECLVLSIWRDDEYSDFRKLLGLCLSIMMFVYMIFQLIVGLILFFKKCKCKEKKSKKHLSKLIMKKGLGMQQIFGAKQSSRRLK